MDNMELTPEEKIVTLLFAATSCRKNFRTTIMECETASEMREVLEIAKLSHTHIKEKYKAIDVKNAHLSDDGAECCEELYSVMMGFEVDMIRCKWDIWIIEDEEELERLEAESEKQSQS